MASNLTQSHATDDTTSYSYTQNQIQKLRSDFNELQEIVFAKLEHLETQVTAAQRYVSSIVPWSQEVREKYTKLLEVVEKHGGDHIGISASGRSI